MEEMPSSRDDNTESFGLHCRPLKPEIDATVKGKKSYPPTLWKTENAGANTASYEIRRRSAHKQSLQKTFSGPRTDKRERILLFLNTRYQDVI